jgi:Zn-dependent protease with chaperone function
VDFFAAQARARQQSRLISLGFAASVVLVVIALDAVVLTALRVVAAQQDDAALRGSLLEWSFAHPDTVLAISLLVGGFIGTASLVRVLQLRAGGGFVARSVGGVRVERSTMDPRRRMLHNVVDEMALASGVPAPEVYVLENEDGINAFAAGHTPANAAIAVTRGALLRLNRDQLQGVIAHEFSHILNGDMRLSIRLMGLVFGLMAVTIVGRTLLRLGRESNRSGGAVMLLGAGIAIVGLVGFWTGRVLQAWISRKRECLADASAVQFTRNPEGLKQALVRVAAMGLNRRFASPNMEQVAHMLFSQGGLRMLATHPPMLERLEALDPSMTKPRLDAMIREVQAHWQREGAGREEPARAGGAPRPVPVPAAAALIAATAGEPRARHLEYAVALRRALPPALRGSADAPELARAALLGLVASHDSAARESQLAHISATLGSGPAGQVRELLALAENVEPLLRLPAVMQLLPALRPLPLAQRQLLIELLLQLTRMDGSLSVSDWALEKLASRSLQTTVLPQAPHGTASLESRSGDIGVLFAVLAAQGSRDSDQARRAYESGIGPLLPRERPGYAVIEDWPPVLDASLDRLCGLHPLAKQMLVEGLVHTIAHDETLAVPEAELLRAICAVLECPLPPVLPPVPGD